MNKEEFEQFNKKIRSKGIVISRVPQSTRDKFVKLAEDEFSQDYGLCLKWCLDQAIEYKEVKKLLFNDKFLEELKCYVNTVEKS